jgi:hypothetical protein
MGCYCLIAVAVATGPSLAGFPVQERPQYPRVLCSFVGVPNVPFRFSICTQKLSYTAGDIANITLATTSTANINLIVRDSFYLEIVRDSTYLENTVNPQTVFSNAGACGIPEGCPYPPRELVSFVSLWKTSQPGDYVVVGNFTTRLCADHCGPSIASGSSTIGLSIRVLQA